MLFIGAQEGKLQQWIWTDLIQDNTTGEPVSQP